MHRRFALLADFVLLGMLLTSGFGLLAFAPTASADHETVDWSRQWSVTTDPRWQLNPATFTDGAGHLYLFFYDLNSANGNTNISMWRYATRGPTGNPVFQIFRQVNPSLPNIVVTTNRYGQAWPPSVARDHNGALYVAWTDTSSNVWVSKSSDNGSSWGAPSRVDPTSANSADTGPVIVAAPSGTLYIAWLQFWLPGGARSITTARSTDQGVTWGAKTNITTPTTTADFLTHSLAVDSTGRLHLAYASLAGGLVTWDSNYSRSDDGIAWTPPVRLDSPTTYGIYPTILVDASNRVHVIWYDGRQSSSGTTTYWYRRSNDRGLTWTMEMPISQGRFSTGASAGLMLSASGDTVMAAWPVFTTTTTIGYAVSADAGDLWTPERAAEFGTAAVTPSLAVDENGTFYSAFYRGGFDASYAIWDGPPSAPAITGIARGSSSLTVSWSASREGDVTGYRLWRSSDGVTYELAGTFGSATLAYADTGLSNGTYWYRVTSFDSRGTSSHASDARSASVGKSVQERLDDLDAALGSANADLAAIQAQIDALRANIDSKDAATRARLDDLQARLNASAAQSYLNTFLIIIVILLLVFMFLQARRKSMRPQILSPVPPGYPPMQNPPAGPPMMPAQPPEPRLPDEEL